MKITFEHKDVLPVTKYGGTERIIYWLMKELVTMGHQVSLIGHPDSQVQSLGISLIPNNPKEKDYRHLIPKDTDVVHLFYTPHLESHYPTLVTIEGNGKVGESFHPNTVFVSKNHAQRHGGKHFVYNGLDFSEYPFPENPKPLRWKNFLFLAKAKWKVKNLEGCVTACKKNQKHLHVAGGFQFHFSRWLHFYGMIDQNKKQNLLPQMDALLFPVRWHEPFGIAIIEAMAYGLPVIGSPYGSLPELIPEGVGSIVYNQAQFQDLIGGNPPPFSRAFIRNHMEKYFSQTVMAQNYLSYYQRLKDGEKLHNYSPTVISANNPEELLPF